MNINTPVFIPLWQSREETWKLIQEKHPEYAKFLVEFTKAFYPGKEKPCLQYYGELGIGEIS